MKQTLHLSALCARYLAHLQTRGNKPASISSAAANLASLPDLHPLHIASISPQRAKEAYRELTTRLAVSTHQATLRRWRSLWAFALEEGLAKTNPWLLVRPLGRPRKGKPQLTLDEAQKLSHLAEQERSDEGLGVLLALHMGLRNGEVRGLNVRDFDLGRLLRIQDSKTAAGRRVLEVPDFLRRPLQQRAAGRPRDEPLLRNQLGQRPTARA